jgi:hypothetical protein
LARRPHRRDQHLDPLGGNDRVEPGAELRIPIANQELVLRAEPHTWRWVSTG